VKDKYIGPLIKTVMTRCIQCTRCVRFAAEVAGVPELGGTNRGENMEIGTYVEKALTSELSGNLIDICPVGALTSRPYAFVSRPWELRRPTASTCWTRSGANIRVDTPRPRGAAHHAAHQRGGERGVDGRSRPLLLRRPEARRLDRPWVRKDGKLVAGHWPEAFAAIAKADRGLPGDRIGAPSPATLADAESVARAEGPDGGLWLANLDCRDDFAAIDASRPDFFRFNTTIAGIEEADALLIIGSDPRARRRCSTRASASAGRRAGSPWALCRAARAWT
jgi:NADH-quinone oxidoreductase subunit G